MVEEGTLAGRGHLFAGGLAHPAGAGSAMGRGGDTESAGIGSEGEAGKPAAHDAAGARLDALGVSPSFGAGAGSHTPL